MRESISQFEDEADAIDASLFNQERVGLVTPKKLVEYNMAILYVRDPEKHPRWRGIAAGVIRDALWAEGELNNQARNATIHLGLAADSGHTELIHRLADLWARFQRR